MYQARRRGGMIGDGLGLGFIERQGAKTKARKELYYKVQITTRGEVRESKTKVQHY